MKKEKIGLLVMAYGTPDSLDEVEAYYTHIRHGRKPSEEALQDLIDAIKRLVEFHRLQNYERASA